MSYELSAGEVVPVERIELPTFGLQNRCSTAELNRHPVVFVRKYRMAPLLLATTRLQSMGRSGGEIAEFAESD
jgi:hypothetical protein